MLRRQLLHAEVTESVIGAFYEVYRELGFGFLEHIYVLALERELRARGHTVLREVGVSVRYKGEELGRQRMDMIVDHVLVIEIKATEVLPKMSTRQVYNYLRATNLELGLVLHFGPEPAFHRVFCRRHGSVTTGHSEGNGMLRRRAGAAEDGVAMMGPTDDRSEADPPEHPDPPEGP